MTLHVGLDTFRPVTEHRLEEHRIHGERYSVRPKAWERIRAAERVVAVGTTTVRVLETLARGASLEGRTELFVTPGFEFLRVDHLVTNFHLPRTSLLLLVGALPTWGHSRSWGYYPSGGLGLLLVILLILMLMGYIPNRF